MRSAAALFGHGLHPIMVTIPLGSIPTAIVFDALYVWTDVTAWAMAGFVATAIGALGIIAASVPGMVDFLRVVPREGEVWKRATSHMALGWALGAYYIAFVVARWLVFPAPSARVAWILLGVNVVGFGLMMLQGYWGGELVARHHIGVEERPSDARKGNRRARHEAE